MPLAPEQARIGSAERSSPAETRVQNDQLCAHPVLPGLLEAMPDMVAILNAHRQVVMANGEFTRALEVNDLKEILGERPGESAGCPNALSAPGGCGTAPECASCGALCAILGSQDGEVTTRECTIQREAHLEPLDLRIKATPLPVGREVFTVFALQDISRDKKYRMLERTFFHDILNTAGGVQGLAMLMDDAEDMDEIHEFAPLLANQSEQLVAAIEAQRDMLAAERGELEVAPLPVGSLTVVQGAIDLYRTHPVAEDKVIRKDPDSVRRVLVTGKVLLQRTLGNMLKNALEASVPGQEVTIGCLDTDQGVRFHVHNPTVIPDEVQAQIFRRSYSTKGEGRGLGTYSMKLLGEKHLSGRVGFRSEPGAGTTFWIDLPLDGAT